MSDESFLNATGLSYLIGRLANIYASKGEIPKKVGDLTNDANYQDANQVIAKIQEYGYQNANDVSEAITEALADITEISFEIVEELPASGTNGTFYLVSNEDPAPNAYDEYVWMASTSTFEKIGSTSIDLSGYWNSENLVPITTAEIDTLFGD